MTARDAFPVPAGNDIEAWAALEIDLDALPGDAGSETGCPDDRTAILEYVTLETFGWFPDEPGYDPEESLELTFLRTAQIASHRYWIWSVSDEEDIWTDGYVLFEVSPKYPDGLLGIYEGEGLTPEQFIWRQHHHADA